MAKRDTKTDVPRRIYQSTIKRMDSHLKYPTNSGQTKTLIKRDFNEFLVALMDLYEGMQKAETFYATKLYSDVSEARGEAIKEAVKHKRPVEFPKMVIIMGEDDDT